MQANNSRLIHRKPIKTLMLHMDLKVQSPLAQLAHEAYNLCSWRAMARLYSLGRNRGYWPVLYVANLPPESCCYHRQEKEKRVGDFNDGSLAKPNNVYRSGCEISFVTKENRSLRNSDRMDNSCMSWHVNQGVPGESAHWKQWRAKVEGIGPSSSNRKIVAEAEKVFYSNSFKK